MPKEKSSAGRHGPEFWKEEQKNTGYKMMSKMGWQEGQGLGKESKGRTSMLKARKKNNFEGIGLSSAPDTFSVTASMFNDVLQKLNQIHSEGSSAKDPDEDKDVQCNVVQAVNTRMARQGLYCKFRKAKDTSSYSQTSLAEIFGHQNKKKEKLQEPESPPQSEINVQTSNVSMKDYFANKLSQSTKKVTKFQTASGNGFSLNMQTEYYNRMMDISSNGVQGLGFGRDTSSESGENTSSLQPPLSSETSTGKRKKKKTSFDQVEAQPERTKKKKKNKERT